MDNQPWVQPSWEHQSQPPQPPVPEPPRPNQEHHSGFQHMEHHAAHPPMGDMAPMPVHEDKNAATVAWQWITYILWEATLFTLSVFLIAVLAYFITGASSVTYSFSIYSMAALVCLLPAAFLVDRCYRKREPEQKQGFAGVVMVLNVVVVMLAIVGGVVAAAFSLFSLLLDNESAKSVTVTVISSLVVSLLGVLLFWRILPNRRVLRLVKLFPWVVMAVSVAALVMALAGPVRTLLSSRNDRLIEDNVTTLDSAIQDYFSQKAVLPASLKDLSLSSTYQSGAKQLIDRHLVEYEPGIVSGSSPTINAYDPTSSSYDYSYSSSDYGYKTADYKLCMTFGKAKGNGAGGNKDLFTVSSDHGSGRQCYDLTATSYK